MSSTRKPWKQKSFHCSEQAVQINKKRKMEDKMPSQTNITGGAQEQKGKCPLYWALLVKSSHLHGPKKGKAVAETKDGWKTFSTSSSTISYDFNNFFNQTTSKPLGQFCPEVFKRNFTDAIFSDTCVTFQIDREYSWAQSTTCTRGVCLMSVYPAPPTLAGPFQETVNQPVINSTSILKTKNNPVVFLD